METRGILTKSLYDNKLKNVFTALYILMLVYIAFYPLSIMNIVTLWIGRVLIISNWVVAIYILALSIYKDVFRISALIAAVMIPSAVFASHELETDLIFQSAGSFLALLFLIEGQEFIEIKKNIVKLISYSNIILVALFMIYSFMPFAYKIEGEYVYIKNTALTLGYSNPNSTGMLLIYSAAINLISNRCKLYDKYLTILIQVLLIYLMIRTNSRTSLFCILLLTFLSLLNLRKVPKSLIIAFAVVPVAYIQSVGFIDNMTIFGKSVYTGREKIFTTELESFNDWFSWLFGDLSVGKFSNHHNAPLSIMLSCGIIGLALYITLYLKNIWYYAENPNSISYIAICAVLVLLLHSSAEAAFLIGSIPYGVMTTTLFVLVRCREEDFG